MGFMDVLIGAGVGFLTGGPVGAIAGGAVGAGLIELPGAQPTAAIASSTALTTATIGAKPAPAAAEQTTLQKIAGILGGGVASGVAGAISPVVTQAVLKGGAVAACPTGKNRVQTIIQVIKPDGTVCSQKVEAGRPFLMNRDIVTAKRVFRQVAKMSGRLPRRTVAQSKAKMLTDAALDKALRDTISDNGNGNGGKC